MQDTTVIMRRKAQPIQTVYVKGRSFRLEYNKELTHPFQLVYDWNRVMNSDDMASGSIRIVRPKAKVRSDDETRVISRR